MGERVSLNDSIKKNDLELILEVNRKAIEIETTVADQNEEMMTLLNKCREKQDKTEEKIDKLLKQTEDTGKEIFKLQVLFVSGLISLVIQIVQIFMKK
jgi:hypothetical protein